MDIGGQLRQAREARGLTIDTLARSTRVQARILSAIEQNDCATIPPRPYGRGFVRTFAAEVGLDPASTVRDFFAQFGVVEQPPPPVVEPPEIHLDTPESNRRWLWPVGAVLGYAAVGALVIAAGQVAMKKSSEPGAVGTAGTAVPALTSATERPPTPVPARPPTDVSILLEAVRPAWVTAVVDGDRTVFRTLQPGERVSLRGLREVSIRTGDAGALNWQVNGRATAPMGLPGEVLTVKVTPETAAVAK